MHQFIVLNSAYIVIAKNPSSQCRVVFCFHDNAFEWIALVFCCSLGLSTHSNERRSALFDSMHFSNLKRALFQYFWHCNSYPHVGSFYGTSGINKQPHCQKNRNNKKQR